MLTLRNRISEIVDELRLAGKVSVVPDAVMIEIEQRIKNEMIDYRAELMRKRKQSESDLWNIVLTD